MHLLKVACFVHHLRGLIMIPSARWQLLRFRFWNGLQQVVYEPHQHQFCFQFLHRVVRTYSKIRWPFQGYQVSLEYDQFIDNILLLHLYFQLFEQKSSTFQRTGGPYQIHFILGMKQQFFSRLLQAPWKFPSQVWINFRQQLYPEPFLNFPWQSVC